VHRLHGIQYVALSAAQRRKAQKRKLQLKPPHIAPTECKIVSEISCASAMRFMQSHWAIQE
jgi:hypothetical protein